jgi:hypothetical protein
MLDRDLRQLIITICAAIGNDDDVITRSADKYRLT